MTKSTPKSNTSKGPAPKLTVKPKAAKAATVAPSKNVKKTTRKKPVTSAKKISAPKAISVKKKPSTPKAVSTISKKTVSKKPTPAKTSTKSSKTDLLKTVADLETRMKRANTLTRKSVKALESAVMTLDARTRKDNSTGKAALTRKVNQLSAKLTEMVEKTQAEVNSELKTVLNNPSAENLQAALFRADQRLSSAEQNQAAAISKINRHLASMATAADTRIEEEANARKTAIATLQTDVESHHNALTARIDTIEADTARALSGAGDKISQLSEEMTRRGEASELSIREKVSEIALQTQTEFETYRAGLERRIDEVAHRQSDNDTQRLEHSIATLTARLESLEYTVSAAPEISAPQSEPFEQVPTPSPPQLSIVQTQNHTADVQHLPDAFSPTPQMVTASATAMPNPYLVEQAETTPVIETEGPVEFDPSVYSPSPQDTLQTPPPPPAPISEPIRDFTQPDLMPAASPAPELLPPPIDQTTPYADPAYAEANPTMDRVRIDNDKPQKLNMPKLTGRNLRVAALATGVAVIGLVAAKGVFGGDANSPKPPQQTAQNVQAPSEGVAPVSIPKPDTSVAPIGDYADNKAVNVAPSSDAAKTLNSAASAGDPIAQFQLGLSYLEQGRTDEGVALIRKSANQNQPAAQYRLAKLYEIGEGVSQDSEMARQLTERAARNGNRIAMHDLALYYAEGRGGVEADLPTAANWFEKAAERGVVDSQFNLGVLFESGQGIPKNMTDAFVWYSIAAGQGDQFAKTRVEVLKTTLDKADLVTAAARAEKFKPVKIDDAANGIFRNVAWVKSNEAAGKKVSQVRQAQTMLTELGYEIGGADGAVGPKTRAAIMSFERANSLPETGRVNTALIDRLELATGA